MMTAWRTLKNPIRGNYRLQKRLLFNNHIFSSEAATTDKTL